MSSKNGSSENIGASGKNLVDNGQRGKVGHPANGKIIPPQGGTGGVRPASNPPPKPK